MLLKKVMEMKTCKRLLYVRQRAAKLCTVKVLANLFISSTIDSFYYSSSCEDERGGGDGGVVNR